MRVMWFLQSNKRTGARAVGERVARSLSEADGVEVVLVDSGRLDVDPGKPFVRDGDVVVPTVDLVSATAAINPDAVVVHAFGSDLIEAMPVIGSMVPSVVFADMNLIESHANGNYEHLRAVPRFVRSFDAAMVPSDHSRDALEGMGVDRGRISVVRDPPRWGEPDPPLEDRSRAVGVVGRMARIKNLPVVARALRWYEDNLGRAPRVLVAGEPGETVVGGAPLARHAEALSVEHLIEFLGWVDPFEEVYPEVRATVVPSLSEGHPAVRDESLSTGVPVLVPHSAWAEGAGSYHHDSPPQLARAMERAVREPAALRREQHDSAPGPTSGPAEHGAAEAAEEALREVVTRCGKFKMKART